MSNLFESINYTKHSYQKKKERKKKKKNLNYIYYKKTQKKNQLNQFSSKSKYI